jgi:hypothetical protein
MAANVATPATMAIGIMDQNTVGTVRKRRRPVSLLDGPKNSERRDYVGDTLHTQMTSI